MSDTSNDTGMFNEQEMLKNLNDAVFNLPSFQQVMTDSHMHDVAISNLHSQVAYLTDEVIPQLHSEIEDLRNEANK